MTRSPFLVNVADLRHEHAVSRPETLDVSVDWAVEMSSVLPDPPLRAELILSRVSGGIVVQGPVTFTARHACHRCLAEWDEEMTIETSQLYAEGGRATDDDYALDGNELDLEPMLRDEVLLAMPMVPTCRDECAGLVEGSQTDLNTPTPDEADIAASPFAVLKDLLGPGQ